MFTWELASEEEKREVCTYERNCDHNAIDNSQTVTREHIIGEGIPSKARHNTRDKEDATYNPIQLTWTTESPCKEDTKHVDTDGQHKHESRPVVNLTDQQASANIKRDI